MIQFILTSLLLTIIESQSQIVCKHQQMIKYEFKQIKQLQTIHVFNCSIQLIVLQISAVKSLPQLKKLSLSFCGLNEDLAYNILSNIQMPKLQYLDLSFNNNLGNEVFKKLKKKKFENITYLDLTVTGVNSQIINILGTKNLTKLQQINLSGNDLTSINKNVKLTLPNLKTLVIIYSGLKRFPFYTNNFQKIILDYNDLKKYTIEQICKLNLTNLTFLSLAGNNISLQSSKILGNLSTPKLQFLKFSQCKIDDQKMLHFAKLQAPQLKRFFASKNIITDIGLSKFLQKHRNVIKMEVSQNRIYSLQAIQYLSENATQLNMSSNYIGDQYFSNIAKLSKLQILVLVDNQITVQALIQIPATTFSNLKVLLLQKNPIFQSAFEILSNMKLENLQVLTLGSSRIGGGPYKQYIKLNLPKLKILQLRSCRLKSQDLKYFSEANLPQLEQLLLQNNDIDDEGLLYLSKINLTKIEQFSLYRNKITGIGFKYFDSQALSSLKDFDLSDINLTPEGMSQVSKLYLPVLKLFLLYNNKIGNEGLKYLSKMFLPELEGLSIRNTSITDDGLKQFAENIKFQLNKIDLSLNNITNSGVLQLIQVNQKIQLLDCYACRLSNGFFQALPDQFAQNIKILMLQRNNFDDQFILQLEARSSQMQNLIFLSLRYNLLHDFSIQIMIRMEFKALAILLLGGNDISQEAKKKFLQNHMMTSLVKIEIGAVDMDLSSLKNMLRQPIQLN